MSQVPNEVTVSVGEPDMPEFLRPIYANQINVVFAPHDFRMIFSVFTPPVGPPPGSETGAVELHPTAVADILLPATVMHAFIGLLNQQFARYLDQFGAPGLNPEGPGGGGA